MISLVILNQHIRRLSIFSSRLISSKVPREPISLEKPKCVVKNIDNETILHLERLSLVDFGNKKCVKILEEAIQFAEQLSSVNTEGVEPLISVLEESHLRLREDQVTDGNKRLEVLSNAKITEEDYFVAPPGNIPADPSQSLKKILELADTHGFFSPVKVLGQDFVNNFRLGPTGELLAQNIQKEWIHSCVSSGLPETVFQHHSPSSDLPTAQRLKGAFASSKNLMNGKVPFALVEVRGVEKVEGETNDVLPRTRHPLHYVACVNQKSGQQFFYRWQQHRHMWWRKFSMDPGRFSLVENKDSNVSQVDIKVKFPWGDFTVETVKNHGLDFFGSVENGDKNGFEVYDNRKKGLPHIVESNCTLESAMLCYLCDGFSTSGKSQFTLHRRLAPYKVAIAASAEPATDLGGQESADELEQLASYLSKQLTRAGVCSLPPDLRRPLDTQLARYHALAVPYVLLLSPATLSTSIATLRSQLTSAKEEISLSNLISYMEQLTKKV